MDQIVGLVDLMDIKNQRPPEVGEPLLDPLDWRSRLPVDARPRIVNNIINVFKTIPSHSHMGLPELERIAATLEEKIYAVASSQLDYLRKISLKMVVLKLNTKPRSPSNLKRHRVLAFGTD